MLVEDLGVVVGISGVDPVGVVLGAGSVIVGVELLAVLAL